MYLSVYDNSVTSPRSTDPPSVCWLDSISSNFASSTFITPTLSLLPSWDFCFIRYDKLKKIFETTTKYVITFFHKTWCIKCIIGILVDKDNLINYQLLIIYGLLLRVDRGSSFLGISTPVFLIFDDFTGPGVFLPELYVKLPSCQGWYHILIWDERRTTSGGSGTGHGHVP